MILKERKIGNTTFYLTLEQVGNKFDLAVSCNNWCSGYLRSKYDWTQEEITQYFDTADLIQDANSAWDDHYERQLGC